MVDFEKGISSICNLSLHAVHLALMCLQDALRAVHGSLASCLHLQSFTFFLAPECLAQLHEESHDFNDLATYINARLILNDDYLLSDLEETLLAAQGALHLRGETL